MARAAKDPNTRLTPKQTAFCLEYIANGGNASAAYRMTYPGTASDVTVKKRASELLHNGDIAGTLTKLRAAITRLAVERAAVDKSYVMNGLREVAERCLQYAPVLDRKGQPVAVELENGELRAAYTFEPAGANRALELLGKEIGMFVERREQGGPGEFDELSKMSKEELWKRAQQKAVKLGLGKVITTDKAKR